MPIITKMTENEKIKNHNLYQFKFDLLKIKQFENTKEKIKCLIKLTFL